ncbi:SPL family radical SAM protein [Paenibacillus silvae]|nr:radical SAM protein [Paenibacillus silvae]MCK6269258.1 radical SAM protein [Paenibacillus silvae]
MKESLFSIRTYSIRLSTNLYSGCAFDCSYCYAPFIHKFNKGVTPDEFGSRIFIKENAKEILEKQISQMKQKIRFKYEYVDLGTITDCYQPIEAKKQLTRSALEVFSKNEIPVTLLTKSHLVTRDIDLLQPLAEKGRAAVGFSITTSSMYEPRYKRFLEPKSPPTKFRLQALKKIRDAGIPTYVFVNPVVPFMSGCEESIHELFKEIRETGNTNIFFGVMKLNPLTWSLFKKRLGQFDSNLIKYFQHLYIDEGKKEFNRSSLLPSSNYLNNLYEAARNFALQEGLGFSCEGGNYNLWLNDWADCEKGYNYPTGYNLWCVIRNNPSFTTYQDLKLYLEQQYPVLDTSYFSALESFWQSGELFNDLNDIQMVNSNDEVVYQYRGTSINQF